MQHPWSQSAVIELFSSVCVELLIISVSYCLFSSPFVDPIVVGMPCNSEVSDYQQNISFHQINLLQLFGSSECEIRRKTVHVRSQHSCFPNIAELPVMIISQAETNAHHTADKIKPGELVGEFIHKHVSDPILAK